MTKIHLQRLRPPRSPISAIPRASSPVIAIVIVKRRWLWSNCLKDVEGSSPPNAPDKEAAVKKIPIRKPSSARVYIPLRYRIYIQ